MKRFLTRFLMVFCACFPLQAQKSLSVSIPELDNSVVAEQASFQIDDGYEAGSALGPLHVGLPTAQAR
jgi:hypothetical protein